MREPRRASTDRTEAILCSVFNSDTARLTAGLHTPQGTESFCSDVFMKEKQIKKIHNAQIRISEATQTLLRLSEHEKLETVQ